MFTSALLAHYSATMASKRPFSEVDGAADQDPRANSHASTNPRKRKRPEKKGKPKGDSINALKKRVRTIERRFKNGATLPPNVTAELQRELATSRAMIEEATLKKKRRDMISKYHMVRFFGRYTPYRVYSPRKLELTRPREEKGRAPGEAAQAPGPGRHGR